MRVLVLSTELPWPASRGGTVRSLAQLRLLASLPEVSEVTQLGVIEDANGETRRRALEAEVPKVRALPPVFHPVHLRRFPAALPRVVLLRTLGGLPYVAAKWDSPALHDALECELRAGPFDVIWIDSLGMTRYVPQLRRAQPRARLVLDQHNVESDLFAQFAARRRGLVALAGRAEHRASLRYEARALREVEAVVATSLEDAARFRELAGIEAHVVPYVVEPSTSARAWPDRPRFCWVGSLDWHPNVRGLDWFCTEVWPRLRARVPDATLEIVGSGLRRDRAGRLQIPKRWRAAGLETVGFLEALDPLYARSRVFLAPVLGGSGIRIKILEAFRAGLPVVTTHDGARGLPVEDDRELLVASDPEGFAERAARVVSDRALADRLCSAASHYVERHHSLAAAQDVMRRVIGVA